MFVSERVLCNKLKLNYIWLKGVQCLNITLKKAINPNSYLINQDFFPDLVRYC